MTGFVDTISAYETLPDRLKAAIEGLHVVYTVEFNAEYQKFGLGHEVRFVRGSTVFYGVMKRQYTYLRVIHPMVYAQAETGRKVLNVSPGFALGIYENGAPDGDALLREVIDHCVDPKNAWFHSWLPGDMVLWDNWRALHCSTGIDPGDTRVLHRTVIAGDYALGRRLDGGEQLNVMM
jgi:taurine dioxygenase